MNRRKPLKIMLLLAPLFALGATTSVRAQGPATPPARRPAKKSATAQPGAAQPDRRAAPAAPTQAKPAPAKAPPNPPAQTPTQDKAKGKAQGKAKDNSKLLQKVLRFLSFFKPSTVWYLQYRFGGTREQHGQDASTYNRFFVGRGYLTLKFIPTKWFEARITMDTHQDDHGDWKMRLKYLYAKFKVPIETKVITEPYVEFGIAHIPWLDYEEHINYYRAQGTMFIERNKIHNSADLGLTVGVLFGKKLPKAYREKVSKKYPGTWGSAAFGVYNGGGYHALEENKWKNVEGRVSLRPLGHLFPNLQVSYFFIWGKGNTRLEPANPGDPTFDYPNWQENIFMLSFEHQYLVATAQVAFGQGTQQGDRDGWLDADGQSKRYAGASGFLELRLPWIKSSLWGRFDYWDGPYDEVNIPYQRIIAAYAFHFWGEHKNFLMLDFEYLMFDDDELIDTARRRRDQWAVTLTVQVKLK